MNRATRAAAVGLSICAGVTALIHGIFEILQGGYTTDGLIIHAMGPACQPETVWHACLPALTIIPGYLVSGIVVVLLSAALIVWSLIYAGRRFGSVGLFVLSIGLLPVGGGFVPVWIGLLGAAAATQIRREPGAKEPGGFGRFLAGLWPGMLLVLIAWLVLSWILGWLFPGVMQSLRIVLLILMGVFLPLLTALAGGAYDRVRKYRK